MTVRRIRVHLPGYPTFVLESTCGEVSGVTLDDARSLLGLPEVEVAERLRASGATFVDLDRDRTTVKTARGYRPRDERPEWKPRGRSLENAEGPSPYKTFRGKRSKDKDAPDPPSSGSATLDSLRNGKLPIEDVEIPF